MQVCQGCGSSHSATRPNATHHDTPHPTPHLATLNAYLKAAAEFITAAGLPDPRFTTTMQHTMPDEYLPRIGKVLAEQKHGEFMPDQKDPVTPAMVSGYRANPPQRAAHRP